MPFDSRHMRKPRSERTPSPWVAQDPLHSNMDLLFDMLTSPTNESFDTPRLTVRATVIRQVWWGLHELRRGYFLSFLFDILAGF